MAKEVPIIVLIAPKVWVFDPDVLRRRASGPRRVVEIDVDDLCPVPAGHVLGSPDRAGRAEHKQGPVLCKRRGWVVTAHGRREGFPRPVWGLRTVHQTTSTSHTCHAAHHFVGAVVWRAVAHAAAIGTVLGRGGRGSTSDVEEVVAARALGVRRRCADRGGVVGPHLERRVLERKRRRQVERR